MPLSQAEPTKLYSAETLRRLDRVGLALRRAVLSRTPPAHPAPESAQLLALWLDVVEPQIRTAIADPRLARNLGWLLSLQGALEDVARAREALAQCPDGAELALLVLAIETQRLAPAAEIADRHYRAQKKGAAARKAKPHEPPDHHTAIRALARKLDPDLTVMAKARIIHRKFPQVTVRTIHGILSKVTAPARKKRLRSS